MGLKKLGCDSLNPGVNAWASRKVRAMVFGVNAPMQARVSNRRVDSLRILLSRAPARRIFIWPSSVARCLHIIRRLPAGMRDGPLESQPSRER